MQQISHVLQASGMGEIDAASSLSFSFSRETTDEEIDRGTDIIQDCVNRLQKASKTLL
jgi:cysteine desulfurase